MGTGGTNFQEHSYPPAYQNPEPSSSSISNNEQVKNAKNVRKLLEETFSTSLEPTEIALAYELIILWKSQNTREMWTFLTNEEHWKNNCKFVAYVIIKLLEYWETSNTAKEDIEALLVELKTVAQCMCPAGRTFVIKYIESYGKSTDTFPQLETLVPFETELNQNEEKDGTKLRTTATDFLLDQDKYRKCFKNVDKHADTKVVMATCVGAYFLIKFSHTHSTKKIKKRLGLSQSA